MIAADRHPSRFSFPALESIWAAPASDGGRPAIRPGPPLEYEQRLRFPRRVDRPTVIANFVTTLDGVTSYADADAAAGGEISGFSAADRMLMGLLRAHADVVLVGAGTVRAAPHDAWTADSIFPPAAPEYAAIRRRLGMPPQPTTVVVTASGGIDLAHPGFAAGAPVLIVTTATGKARLGRPPANVDIVARSGPRIAADDLLATLHERGAGLVLCEGGPQLMAALLSVDGVDELFLTMAPQVAGRSPAVRRPALVEGLAFHTAEAPWWQLLSVDRAGSHLFLRYRRQRHDPVEVPA